MTPYCIDKAAPDEVLGEIADAGEEDHQVLAISFPAEINSVERFARGKQAVKPGRHQTQRGSQPASPPPQPMSQRLHVH